LLLLLTGVVVSGVERSIWLSVVLVVLQVGGLLLVIFAGAPHIGDEPLLEGAGAGGVVAGAALVFFAFIGFDEVVTLSEEVHEANRVVPRALLLSLGISTLLYVAVGVAAVSAVGASALGAADQPLGLVMEERVGSGAGDVIAVIALASTVNTTLLVLTAAARLIFSMARDGALPPGLATVRRRGGGPWLAALAASAVAIPFALSGSIELIAEVTNFAIYVLFVGVNVAVIRLRHLLPDAPRPFTAPGNICGTPVTAVMGILTSVMLLFYIAPAAWLLGGLLVLSGLGACLIGPYVGRKPVGEASTTE
jgi:APA family basic amino acid/polyamine antiporter